ncbi:MAG: phage holin [Oscillospiraceae bacterium]|nr:phage holin [Oscillospiraceae bacterium]
MKVNWKVRFKNKLWLGSFISAILAIVYTILDVIGVFPNMSEAHLSRLVEAVLLLMSLIGVIVDPTTSGFNDSNRACGYVEPWNDDTESTEDGGNG